MLKGLAAIARDDRSILTLAVRRTQMGRGVIAKKRPCLDMSPRTRLSPLPQPHGLPLASLPRL